MPLSNKDH